MNINYAVSLWDFDHYTFVPPVETLIPMIRDAGFGFELWSGWHHDQRDFFSPESRAMLKPLVQGMPLSLHGSGKNTTYDRHRQQIDAAADLGAGVIVIHSAYVPASDASPVGRTCVSGAPGHSPGPQHGDACAEATVREDRGQIKKSTRIDEDLLAKVLAYAGQAGVRIALENGSLDILQQAAATFPDLGLCLDTGHLYNNGLTMRAVEPIKHRLIHLHLQEPLPAAEAALPLSNKDHYMLGIGGIHREDWALLATMLREVNFDGMGVFEVRPLTAFQNATRGAQFMQQVLTR